MRLAFCTMGLKPEQFWKLTMCELRAVMDLGAETVQCLSQHDLNQLMQKFPDEVQK